jgi:hypothetical protein
VSRDIDSPSGWVSAIRNPRSFPVAPVSCYAPRLTSSIRGNWYGGYQAWVSQEVRQEWVVAEVGRREAWPEVGAEARWVVVALGLVAKRREP